MKVLHTRVAPSPTGLFHLGTARTAYFNWLAARTTDGIFRLRIDDTDLNRNSNDYYDDVMKSMDWLGLDYDSVSRMSDRFDLYLDLAHSMIKDGLAVIDNGAIRLSLPLDLNNVYNAWKDSITGDYIIISPDDFNYIKNMVLIKSDGSPTYHFASTYDDYCFNINCVIRGTDHFSNTGKHVILWHLFNGGLGRYNNVPDFYHVGLIMSPDNKKLSKRDGSSSLKSYIDAGYNRDAVLNFLLRMGWGPTIDDKTTSLVNRDKALTLFFDGGKMKSSNSKFDVDKLNSFDRKYKAFIENAARN